MTEESQENGNHAVASADNGKSNPGGGDDSNGDVIGSAALRPVFLGNLKSNYVAEDVIAVFERPQTNPQFPDRTYKPVPVERVDLKRGYCFVFLKDVVSQEAKEHAERFVSDINGMEVPNVSNALRSEFARGDGRVKKKEDERRKKIEPSETLFVVNFHEEATRKEDLQMLFEPFGELVRIDMKRNYAFVQFRTVEEARKAKEVTNGGKLDQSVLTVEYVARQRGDGGNGRGRDRGRRDDRRDRGGYRDRRDRFDDRRDRFDDRGQGGGGYRDRGPYFDRERGDRRGGYDRGGRDRDDRGPPRRERSPPGYRGRPVSRSRSRSPPQRYGDNRRSRSPPPRDRDLPRGGSGFGGDRDRGGFGDRDRGGYRDRYDDYRDRRGGSPPRDNWDRDRAGERDYSPPRDNFRSDRRPSDDRGYGHGRP